MNYIGGYNSLLYTVLVCWAIYAAELLTMNNILISVCRLQHFLFVYMDNGALSVQKLFLIQSSIRYLACGSGIYALPISK